MVALLVLRIWLADLLARCQRVALMTAYRDCFKEHSIRECVYNNMLVTELKEVG